MKGLVPLYERFFIKNLASITSMKGLVSKVFHQEFGKSQVWRDWRLRVWYFPFKTREMESREGRSVLEGRLEVALKEAEQVNFKTSNHIQSLFVVNIRNQCTAINAKMINIRRLFGILTSKDLAANRNHITNIKVFMQSILICHFVLRPNTYSANIYGAVPQNKYLVHHHRRKTPFLSVSGNFHRNISGHLVKVYQPRLEPFPRNCRQNANAGNFHLSAQNCRNVNSL